MNWKLIIKDKTKQPKDGIYSDWKEQIAEECHFQCIYCSIHESQFGGIDHYHIEHYRPKSIEKFKELINDITNLYYGCPICNRFKGNDWPNEPDDLEVACYPDPSVFDYSELFETDMHNYKIIGKHASTKYMTERLYLNRPQLIYERREQLLKQKEIELTTIIDKYREELGLNKSAEFLKEYLDIVRELQKTLNKRRNIRPYKLAEIRK